MATFVAVSGTGIPASTSGATAPSSGGQLTVYRLDEGNAITVIGPSTVYNLLIDSSGRNDVPANVPFVVERCNSGRLAMNPASVAAVSGGWYVASFPGQFSNTPRWGVW